MSIHAELPRVAFIGLGTMGHPMATRIAGAGYPLAVHDVRQDVAVEVARSLAARHAVSPADAARDAGFVITMLPSSREVEAAVLGLGGTPGVLATARPGTLLLDMSSSDPVRTRVLSQTVLEAGCTLVDAPVSGAVRRARDGTLSIMFGGSEEALEACRPVLSCMGSAIFQVGATGTGHAMKALNNYVSAAGLLATVEALHVGRRFGIDPRVMTQVLNASTGRNNTTENKVEAFMLSGSFASGFLLELMAKDVGIARDLAAGLGVAAPVADLCSELWRKAAAGEGRGADHTAMYRLLDPDA